MRASDNSSFRDAGQDLRVKPETVTSQTAAKIRQAISSGRFRPGERLVESNLCQLMGVSRTTIRETLRRLEAEQLVVNSPNVGPSVAVIDWKAAEQIYEVRALLEGEAAALCAQRVSPEILAEIRRALEGFEKAVEQRDPEERVHTTEAFYEAILRGCGNDVLADAVTRLNARVSLLRATSMSRSGRATESAAELRRMYSEIAKGDSEGARTAAKEHVRSAASAARQVFADQSGDRP
jgi:DNA-binding GntR family transcriptional regulator